LVAGRKPFQCSCSGRVRGGTDNKDIEWRVSFRENRIEHNKNSSRVGQKERKKIPEKKEMEASVSEGMMMQKKNIKKLDGSEWKETKE